MLLITPPRKILDREIDTGFQKWLRFSAMLDSPALLPAEKYSLALLNILGEIPENDTQYFEAIVDFHNCGEAPRGEPAKERLLDWQADSAAIWADFRICAGMDLDKEQLHWWEFMALFRALPESASIKQTMALRAMDLSSITDPKTRSEYARRKRMVSLEPKSLDDWM